MIYAVMALLRLGFIAKHASSLWNYLPQPMVLRGFRSDTS